MLWHDAKLGKFLPARMKNKPFSDQSQNAKCVGDAVIVDAGGLDSAESLDPVDGIAHGH